MKTNWSPEDIQALPYAVVGGVIGAVRYFIVAPLVDQWHDFVETHTPNQEELDALIEDSFKALDQ